jgi:hypothetical protein
MMSSVMPGTNVVHQRIACRRRTSRRTKCAPSRGLIGRLEQADTASIAAYEMSWATRAKQHPYSETSDPRAVVGTNIELRPLAWDT